MLVGRIVSIVPLYCKYMLNIVLNVLEKQDLTRDARS